ncbi:hypothetical protein AAG906_002254 [Vitis piasezkii]
MVGASSSWSRALVQISPPLSPSSVSPSASASVLGAACLGTTLRALRYYLSGLELGTTLRALRYYLSGLEPRVFLGDPWTIPRCGSLHSSSGPPMVSWDFSLGTTFRALRYYLSGLEGKSANHVSEVELGRATWTFLHTLAAQVFSHKPEWVLLNMQVGFVCANLQLFCLMQGGASEMRVRACYPQGTPDFGEG